MTNKNCANCKYIMFNMIEGYPYAVCPKLDIVIPDQDIEGFYCNRFVFAEEINIKLDNEYLTKEETDKIYLTNTINEIKEMDEYRFYRAANEAISLYLKNKEKEK